MAKRKTSSKTSVKDTPLDQIPIEEIWIEYQKTESEMLRNFLMEKYLPLVKYNADRIYAR